MALLPDGTARVTTAGGVCGNVTHILLPPTAADAQRRRPGEGIASTALE